MGFSDSYLCFVACVRITWKAEVIPLCLSGIQVQLLQKKLAQIVKLSVWNIFLRAKHCRPGSFPLMDRNDWPTACLSRADGQGTHLVWYIQPHQMLRACPDGIMSVLELPLQSDKGCNLGCKDAYFLPFHSFVHALLLLSEHLTQVVVFSYIFCYVHFYYINWKYLISSWELGETSWPFGVHFLLRVH